MPTTRRLSQLFRAIAKAEYAQAHSVAKVICDEEEKKGHRIAARQLRGALQSQQPGTAASNGLAASNGSLILQNGLVRVTSTITLNDVVLTSTVRAELVGLVNEWQSRSKLDKHGIPPRTKIILHGPPGCGKSLTAGALGMEIGLPVFVVRFDAVVGAYLGQTAIHLRQLFHFAEVTPCVLLLDELDALGKRRGNPLDVGELDRIVIALMQELEHSRPQGLVVATSNLPKHLDDALWRRFDVELELKRPSQSVLATFARSVAKSKSISLPASVLKQASSAKSFADAESIVIGEARRQLLRNS